MFFVICPSPLRRACLAWTTVIFGLALFSPGLVIHISTELFRVTWVEARAETQPTKADEPILTLDKAIELVVSHYKTKR